MTDIRSDLPQEALKKISLEAIYEPIIHCDGMDLPYCISRHLLYLFEERLLESGQAWVTPTVRELADHFECTPIDVLQAFHYLRPYGLDYDIDNIDSPVTWATCPVRKPELAITRDLMGNRNIPDRPPEINATGS